MPDYQPELPIKYELTRPAAREFARHVNALFNAISRALEELAFDRDQEDSDALQDTYLELQRISFRYKSLSGTLVARDDFDISAETGLRDLEEFLNNARGNVLRHLRVRIPSPRFSSDAIFLHPELHHRRAVGGQEVLYLLRESFEAAVNGKPFIVQVDHPEFGDSKEIDAAARRIPAQKVAPAQFDVLDGRLVVVDQASSGKKGADEGIKQGLDSLVEQGDAIIDALKGGNFDNRICSQFEKLQETLRSGANIVKLGLSNLTAKALTNIHSNELPDALLAMLEGHSNGISMYVAQFDEWQTFVQNAAEAAIGDDAATSLSAFVRKLESELTAHSAYVDPEVPKTIRFLAELISDPKRASKRAVFAFLRTIENLISKTFGYVLDFIGKTAHKTSEKLSDAASSVLVRALVAIGIVSAAGLLPVIGGVSGMEWVATTYKVIAEQVAPQLGVF